MARPPFQLSLSLAIVLLFGLLAPPNTAFHVDWTPQSASGAEDVIDLSAIEVPPPTECDPSVKDFDFASGKSKTIHLFPSQEKTQNREQMYQDKEVLSFTNNLLKSIKKRTSYANTFDEIRTLEKDPITTTKLERTGENNLIQKRSEHTEYHSGGCQAKRHWMSLGSDHYPRFVKSYNCTSETCDRTLGECRPKSYTVKVLRMISPNISLIEEGCDPHLPEKIRCDWKLVPVLVTTYCECFSGIASFGR